MTNKPKTIKDKERLLSGRIEGSWTYEMMETGWNACQASMQAQLDEKNREITRIAKNYAYCLALLKNLVDRRLLSNEAMEAVNNFIKQSEGL